MKLHLNLSLRRALLAAMAAVATFASTATAGIVDTRYDLQYYLDFSRNAGAFAAGATNVQVGYSDGSASFTIPLMPYAGSYARVVDNTFVSQGSIVSYGGSALVSSQFVYGAAHVFDRFAPIFASGQMRFSFNAENGNPHSGDLYGAANIDNFGHDGAISRADKLVTAVAYTPMATDAFMATLNSESWLYRLGNGRYMDSTGTTISTGDNAIGGIIDMDSYKQQANGDWYMYGVFRDDQSTPLDTGVYSGDSGSPLFAWNAENEQFVFVGALWASNLGKGFGNDVYARYNPTVAQEIMATYTVNATFSGTDKITWNAQDAATGEGTLTQGATVINYTGKGTANAIADTKGLTFSTDVSSQQVIELQGDINMGAGALTFTKGDWKLTEAADYTLSSAGFEVQKGASLTLELAGAAGEEIRKVGEGTMTIAGSGNNEASLVVGGGTVVYDIEYKDGKIAGCTLGNAGETRLNRQNGYAASSVRLEGGVAIIVLMGNKQFKTNTVGGDTFTFGNDGGLLNLNGHDLEWGVIQQESSGKGARIGNFTPLGEKTPGLATFTYTGSGQFDGCFVDESNAANDGKAQLEVIYKGGANDSWKLTGNNTNVGGYTVQSGTMVLEGINTHHVWKSDANDWTFASIEGSDVTVKGGAAFQLSHHAQMVGDVVVENGGKFIMNQAVNADYESISGGSKINMAGKEFTTLIGDVRLNGNSSTMTANVQSSAITKIDGSIRMENYDWDASPTLQFVKEGNGILAVSGNVGVPVVEIKGGGLVIEQANAQGWYKWTIGEEGFLAAVGVDHSVALDYYINKTSDGVFALTYDQTSALNLTNKQNLYIGAWGEVHYGSANASLSANNEGNWLLGGGTGTLIVDFKLTGDKDLIVGNEWSSGTVHLTNTANDIKDIYIKGTGNKLTYEEGALGDATISLSYGNALALHDASLLDVVNKKSAGALALSTSADLDLSGRKLAIAALDELTYKGNISLSEGDAYRFGGSGKLTVDTTLNASDTMLIDGQGTTGSSVTLARENAFTGDIIVGGGLELETANSKGDISLHVGHSSTLASANSINLQKGANFYTDGQNLIMQNLSAQSGATISNNGDSNSSLVFYVTEGTETSIADGVLNDNYNTAGLGIIKAGKGTVTMGANANWTGGLVIEDGKVVVNTAIAGGTWYNPSGGVGSSANTIHIGENGTLRVNAEHHLYHSNYAQGWNLYGTYLTQTVTGTGTIEIASGGSTFLTRQKAAFEGTVHVVDNTRLYLGAGAFEGNSEILDNLTALNTATIKVDDGSQVRLTPSLRYTTTMKVNSYSDFIIAGNGFRGSDWGLKQSSLNDGALAIDCGSTVWGNVTLAADASISSSSSNPTTSTSKVACSSSYGVIGSLGGTIRGQILGEGKTLSIKGNEGMTITADSANTYGNLIIDNGNGNNADKFALRLDGGKKLSQTSTALGMGNVTLGGGLILRLAGTGTADQTDVVYTYANDIAAGDGATIQSYNITNKLTGTVTAAGGLNLATANGGVLHLAGGVSGTGTLNIGADSSVILGGDSSATFGGSVVAASGTSLTLTSPSALANTSIITITNSLTLSLLGSDDYTFGAISKAENADSSSLTLSFDFSAATNQNYTTLFTSDITADSTIIDLQLGLLADLKAGSYVLIDGESSNLSTSFTLADTMNGRLSLSTTNAGELILTVGADNRLIWTGKQSSSWSGDTNWKSDVDGDTAYKAGANVMLDDTGADSSGARKTIALGSGEVSLGSLSVQRASYEISGEGSLNGKSLVVANKGDLKLSNTGGNTFTEGVRINDAKLEVSGSRLTANVTAENGADFTLSGSSTLTGNLHLDNASGTISNSTLTGDVTTAGSGTLRLNSVSTSTGRTLSFETGTLTVSNKTLSGTFTFAEGQSALQVQGLSLNNNTVTSTAALDVDSLHMNGCQILLNHAAGTTTEIDTITGNGSLKKHGAGNLNLINANLWSLELKGDGITNISGTVKVTNEPISLGKGTLNLTNGASVSAGQLTAGNTGSGNPTQINIGTGATLTITGSTDADATNNSFLLAHWGSSASSLVLNGGTLNVQNTSLLMGWDSSGRFEVQSGTANLKGIRFSSNRGNADTLLLGTATSGSGRINLGSNGITGIGSNDTVKLGNGTIGATADFSIHGNKEINLIGTSTGTTFDTAGYTVTVNTALAGSGNLIKTGAGTLLLAGDGSAFNGNITVDGGSLAIDAAGKSMLESASSVLINNGTLDISRLNLNDAASCIQLSAGQTFTFSDNASINFGNISANTQYHIFNFGSGTVEGWSDLTAEDIIIGGIKLSEMGRTQFTLNDGGFFSYNVVGDREIVWNGGSSPSNWSQIDIYQNWTGDSNESTAFVNLDSVAFRSNADLTLDGNIHVNNLTLTDGVSLKTTGQLTIHGTMSVGNGFCWDFSGDTTLTFSEADLKKASKIVVGEGATLVMTDKTTDANNTSSAFNNVSGTGDIVLNLATDNGVGFNLSGFAGDITVATGRLQVNTSKFNEASTIYLASSNSELVFNNSCELKTDVVLEADTTFHVNKPQSGLYEGVISGDLQGEDRKLKKAGGSTLILKGRTTLKALETHAGQVVIDSPYALIEMVDGAMNNQASGTLKLAEEASLRVTGDVWSRSNTGILLDKGAELALLGHDICIINERGDDTSLKATTQGGQKYSLSSTDYEIKNARVVFTGSESATLGNKLTNVTLENSISNAAAPANLEEETDGSFYAGSTLTVTNAANTLNGVIAYGGDVMLQNLQAATSLELLEIATGRTVSGYAGSGGEKSNITVTGHALLGGGATLNASLTLADGATLDMYSIEQSAVTLDGTLTFNGQVELGGNLLAILAEMSSWQSQELTLFTGLSDIALPSMESDNGSSVLASTLFSNVQSENMYVEYHVIDNVGSLVVTMTIPEPATTTLSLLALSALAMRRRRK